MIDATRTCSKTGWRALTKQQVNLGEILQRSFSAGWMRRSVLFMRKSVNGYWRAMGDMHGTATNIEVFFFEFKSWPSKRWWLLRIQCDFSIVPMWSQKPPGISDRISMLKYLPPRKTNSPEKQWLEDEISVWNGRFAGDMLIFGGCTFGWSLPCWQLESETMLQCWSSWIHRPFFGEENHAVNVQFFWFTPKMWGEMVDSQFELVISWFFQKLGFFQKTSLSWLRKERPLSGQTGDFFVFLLMAFGTLLFGPTICLVDY